ncbi:MAG TPA: hypothetical protein DCW60_01205 [Sutterella sp.]|nr:hypothetical protein [Sutterella sp.]
MQMQNPLCRVVLDRYAGNLKLSEKLFIIATGNRLEDKSGANRISTKLANRMCVLEFESDIEDWCDWAAKNGMPKTLIQFIRFRPKLLNGFDPKRMINPTPRSWEMVGRVPVFGDDPTFALFQQAITGFVGDGAAAEYVGYMKIVNDLPDFKELLANPETYPVSGKLDIAYATSMKLIDLLDSEETTKAQVSAIITYIARNPPEMCAFAYAEINRQSEVRRKVFADPASSRLIDAACRSVFNEEEKTQSAAPKRKKQA